MFVAEMAIVAATKSNGCWPIKLSFDAESPSVLAVLVACHEQMPSVTNCDWQKEMLAASDVAVLGTDAARMVGVVLA